MHVVITGANRGIGQALAERYEARGDQVTGTSRAADAPHSLDVTDPASHAALARRLDGCAVDLLICNAGVFPDKGQSLADGFPPEMWAEAFATNVTGVFLTIQSLLPNLQVSKAPKIAIISSRLGSQTVAAGGSGGGYIYRASKAAVVNLGLNLAADLKPLGVAVGIYHPGWVRTEMGGEDGDISVAQSSAGLIERFDALNLENAGCFQTWDGQDQPY